MLQLLLDEHLSPKLARQFQAGGVVFLDDRRFPQHDLGTVLKALLHVWDRERNRDWVNQVVYLDRPPEA